MKSTRYLPELNSIKQREILVCIQNLPQICERIPFFANDCLTIRFNC